MALIKVNNRGQSADFGDKNKNLIINGAMQVSQRYPSGTSETSVNSDRYSACDRFKINNNMVHYTVSQETLSSSDAPFAEGFTKALKLDVTTAQASPASTDYTNIQYRFEGQDLQGAAYGTSSAKIMTLSFWVKATKTGTNVITFYQDDVAKQTSVSYTISASDTWEYKTIQCPANVTDVITNDNTRGFIIHWWLGSGSQRQSGSLQSTWTAYSVGDECPGQVNHGDSTSNNFHLTGVQFEYGSSATNFEFRTHALELSLCQRYYEVLADPRIMDSNVNFMQGNQYGSGTIHNTAHFSTKRTNAYALDHVSGTDYYLIYRSGGSDGFDSFSMTRKGYNSCNLYNNTEISGTNGHGVEVCINNSNAFVAIDAEL